MTNYDPTTSLWIEGETRSGKTTRLVEVFRQWRETQAGNPWFASGRSPQTIPDGAEQGWEFPAPTAPPMEPTALAFKSGVPATSGALVLAANNEERQRLGDRLLAAVAGNYPVRVKTPLGFIAEEVVLFWPLLFQRLQLKAQFPLRLRPETEQALATRLWHPRWVELDIKDNPSLEYRLVRSTLDLLLLAGASATPVEDIPDVLISGLAQPGWDTSSFPSAILQEDNAPLWRRMGKLLIQWRQWCWERGLLAYGLIYEFYWRYLLQDAFYQHHLLQRFSAVFADDTDDYPAIAGHLLAFLLDRGCTGTFTFNRDGQVRRGLSADPDALHRLSARCQVELRSAAAGSGERPRDAVAIALRAVTEPVGLEPLPTSFRSLQTVSRAGLLRQTAETIARGVQDGLVRPEEIAIVAPGLDEIARYTTIEILASRGIPAIPLNEQRPLIGSPLVRSLLVLLALVYPGLGRLVERDSVAEMLTVLSQQSQSGNGRATMAIDPVRAGLLADYCFVPDPEQPRLLPMDAFPRWDRLGYQAATAYEEICTWLEAQQQEQGNVLRPNVVALLHRAMETFLWQDERLSFEQLSALGELVEAARHYWEVDRRLRESDAVPVPPTEAIASFIGMLRQGTITANAYPVPDLGMGARRGVALATIFQYRSSRQHHRWQFWLDASSPLWLKGGAANLFAAPLFEQSRSGRPLSADDRLNEDEQRLQRILRDLLGRATERVYLCHSDLAVNGTEQNGPLLSLVHATLPAIEPELTAYPA